MKERFGLLLSDSSIICKNRVIRHLRGIRVKVFDFHNISDILSKKIRVGGEREPSFPSYSDLKLEMFE